MADYRLISNRTHLYKRSSHLLRTPLTKTITLTPDERSWYAVAGEYSNEWPTAGFVTIAGNYRNIPPLGKEMRRHYLDPSLNRSQKWRRVTTAHDPEFVFYQGAYSTSKNTLGGESYMQLCGYHFTIPDKYAGFAVSGISVSLTHGGTILTYGNCRGNTNKAYFAKDFPENQMGSQLGTWKESWAQKFGIFDYLNDPTEMIRRASDNIVLQTATKSGTPTGARDLWGYDRDGYIPIASAPYVQTFSLSSAAANSMNTKRGGWLVGLPEVGISTADNDTDTANDYPIFDNSSYSACAGYWLCCSYWGLSMRITLEI